MTRCPTGFCGPFSVRLDTAYTATFGAKRRNLCTAGMQPTSLVSPIRPSLHNLPICIGALGPVRRNAANF